MSGPGNQINIEYCRLRIRDDLSCEVAVAPEANDPIAQALLNGTYCIPRSFELCHGLLWPGNRVFDAGAHIGTFALPAASIGCEVAAVEASRENVELLKASMHRNKYNAGQTRFHVVDCALGNLSGKRPFEGYGPFGGLAPSFADGQTVEVDVRRADDVVDELGWEGVDLVKIDVEGGELLVLEGMSHILAATPMIMYESNAPRLQRMGVSPANLVRLLGAAGYTSYAVDNIALRELVPPFIQYEGVIDHLAVRGEPRANLGPVIPPRSTQDSIRAIVECSSVDDVAWAEHLVNAVMASPPEIRNAPEVRAILARR